jgi:hypothetical protein
MQVKSRVSVEGTRRVDFCLVKDAIAYAEWRSLGGAVVTVFEGNGWTILCSYKKGSLIPPP